MKILIISPTQSGVGGIARVVQNQVKFLKKNGYDVDIISSENTFTIPIKGLKNPSFMISSFLKTKFKKNYDIVHAHNPASALAMTNISGKKVISLWGVFENQIELLHGSTLGKLSGKFERNMLKHADAIIVASKDIQKYYSQLGYSSHYIPNAIDLNSLPTTENRLYKKQIIYAGRLSKEKGISNLIKVSEDLPDEIHFIILGNGPEENRIKDLVKKKLNIHYLGYQPKEKTIPLIRGSDILIQTSLMEGGLNTTLLEAMACRIPIITTELDVYSDEIKHMKTAYCVKPESPKEILDGINFFLLNKSEQKHIIENSYQIVQNHSWEKIVEKYIKIYENLQE